MWIGEGELANIKTKICMMLCFMFATFFIMNVKINLWWQGW